MSTIRKFVAILIISLTLVIGLHFSLKKILFTDKSAIETALSQHLKCAVKISGNIEFFLLPLPFIKIENILFSDNNWDLVKAHELILHPKLSSIFRGNISLNDIKQIDFETALFDFWSLNVYYKNLLATQENKIDYIPVININNSTIIIHKQKEFASNIYKFNSFINVSDDILKSDSTFFFEHFVTTHSNTRSDIQSPSSLSLLIIFTILSIRFWSHFLKYLSIIL